MKQNGRKGLSLPMEIIIVVVVLVVVALAVVIFTSGSITKTGTQTDESGDIAGDQIMCNTQAISYCNLNPAADTCASGDTNPCPKCTFDVPCSSVAPKNGGDSPITTKGLRSEISEVTGAIG